MKLRALWEAAFPGHTLPGPDLEISGVECDSRKVEKGFLFVAIRGVQKDGAQFADEAVERGAAAVAGEAGARRWPPVPFLEVPDARDAAARLAGAFHGFPSRRVRVIGITGTNGKTTSSFILEHLLKAFGRAPGVIGTVSYRYADQVIPASETTPGPTKLQPILARMAEAGCAYAVMEVSAHALAQNRTGGVDFEAALFTNLTQDHLDYFPTLDAYFDAKAKLFEGLEPGKLAVLNADDPRSGQLRGRTAARVITYGLREDADLRGMPCEWRADSTAIELTWRRERLMRAESPLLGMHNVYNVLGALAVMAGLGFDLREAARRLEGFGGVPGRLEEVACGQDFSVFIDYAHTPDGLENVLMSLRPYRKARLIAVFGCGGDRDRTKRPQMGSIAGRLCDYVFVTSDNPRGENPAAIADEICAGFPEGFKNYSVVLDRRKAIRQAFLAARRGDIVLLAGKGHETMQIVGNDAIPFREREEAEKVLSGR